MRLAVAHLCMTPITTDDAWRACVDSFLDICREHEQVGRPPTPFPFPSLVYCRVLWTLCECIGARTILEIGIGPSSLSGVVFLHYLKSRGGGHLHSIDVDPQWPNPRARALSETFPSVTWTQSYGDSLTIDMPDMIPDVLYIDGAHDQEHASGDVAKFWPRLRPGGYMIFDDFPTICDPHFAPHLAETLKMNGVRFLHLAHHDPHGNGRLVIQKHLEGLP